MLICIKKTELFAKNSFFINYNFFSTKEDAFELDELANTFENSSSDEFSKTGHVMSVSDGIVRISGLEGVRAGEMVEISTSTGPLNGIALNLETDQVCALLLDTDVKVSSGDNVRILNQQAGLYVGYQLLGHVVNPLGEFLDGESIDPFEEVELSAWYLLERDAPGIIDRKPVDTPVETGLKVVDGLFPIGRGQRELIVGDRQTGKTSIAIDTIINQCRLADLTDDAVYCIYVSIGQKLSSLVRIVEILKRENAMDRTVVVSANASAPAALQYLAPYAGCSIAEFFRDNGDHAVIVYDDLTKHANAYRQISLILRRPPGREAYPGDVFYLHSRLLERAANLSEENGSGSLTALPIVETQAGDLSGYIPTNVISITDGQIVTDSELFQSGFRPAVNIGLSVSRVGGAAQNKNFKKIAAKFKRSLAEYREIASFAQFGSEIDEVTAQLLRHGSRLNALLTQSNYDPMPVEKQIVIFLAGISGFFDNIALIDVSKTETSLLVWFENSPIFGPILANLKDEIDEFGQFDEDIILEGIDYFFNNVLGE